MLEPDQWVPDQQVGTPWGARYMVGPLRVSAAFSVVKEKGIMWAVRGLRFPLAKA